MFVSIPGTKEEGSYTYTLKERGRGREAMFLFNKNWQFFLPGGHSFCSSWQEISVFFWVLSVLKFRK
jgi:hypothetical protein